MIKFVALVFWSFVSLPAASHLNDIVYSEADGISLKLDLARPDGAGPFPLCILVHGGGWAHGDKAQQMRPLFNLLLEHGFAYATINYRLAPKYRYPAPVADTVAAMRWVAEHATQYNIDPTKVALVGESAGAFLVEAAAEQKNLPLKLSGLIGFYGPHDLYPADRTTVQAPIAGFLGISTWTPETIAAARDASPINHVSKVLPPTLLVHGTADPVVPFAQSEIFLQLLRKAGVDAELIPVPGGRHGMAPWDKNNLVYKPAVLKWLQAHL